MARKLPPTWAKRVRRWREAALLNAYRGLCLILIGASPVIVKVLLGQPMRAAVVLGGVIALLYSRAKLGAIWESMPIPETVRDKLEEDWAWFSSLTARGPFWRAGVSLIKKCVDCQRMPVAVNALKVTNTKSTSAKLCWEPTVVSYLSDEAYRVELARCVPTGDLGKGTPCNETEWHQLDTVSNDMSAEVTTLEPGTVYACRVTAHNNKGESAPRTLKFVTPQPPSEGKGGRAPAYTWTQDVKEVAMRVLVPAGCKSADLSIAATATSLRMALKRKGEGGADLVICEGTLFKPIDPEEFAWQFVEPVAHDPREINGRVVELTLPKVDATLGAPHWPAVISALPGEDNGHKAVVALLREHPRIDTSLIKTEVPELGDSHLRELHDMMRGMPLGEDRGDSD